MDIPLPLRQPCQRLGLVLALTAIGACSPTNVAELRTMPPDDRVVVEAPIEKVAPCLARAMGDYSARTGGQPSYIYDQSARTAEITAYSTREPLVFAQLAADGNTTVVELRLGIRYAVNSPVPRVAAAAIDCGK